MSKQDLNTKKNSHGNLPDNWEIKRLKEIAEIDKDSLSAKTPADYLFDYISLSDIDSDKLEMTTTKQVFKNAPSRARRIVSKGDVLLSTVRPSLQGFIHITKEVKDLIASTGFSVITPFEEDGEYIYQYLFSTPISKQFYTLLVGSNYPAINSSDVRNLKIAYPPKIERKKIAAILHTWDSTINKTQQLITLLEQRNKGLMQELLTGKRRLKGFEGNWERIHICDIAKEVSEKNRENKNLTVFSCTKYNGLVPSLEYFGRRVFGEDTSTYKLVPHKHFAYATNHIEEGSIGYQYVEQGGLISPMYTVFKTNNKVDDTFLFMLLKTHQYIHEYQKRMEGSIDRRGGLRWDAFSKIPLLLPSIKEQQEIAVFLNTAVDQIKLYQNKLKTLKDQKKGLMQKLLTGDIRVSKENHTL